MAASPRSAPRSVPDPERHWLDDVHAAVLIDGHGDGLRSSLAAILLDICADFLEQPHSREVLRCLVGDVFFDVYLPDVPCESWRLNEPFLTKDARDALFEELEQTLEERVDKALREKDVLRSREFSEFVVGVGANLKRNMPDAEEADQGDVRFRVGVLCDALCRYLDGRAFGAGHDPAEVRGISLDVMADTQYGKATALGVAAASHRYERRGVVRPRPSQQSLHRPPGGPQADPLAPLPTFRPTGGWPRLNYGTEAAHERALLGGLTAHVLPNELRRWIWRRRLHEPRLGIYETALVAARRANSKTGNPFGGNLLHTTILARREEVCLRADEGAFLRDLLPVIETIARNLYITLDVHDVRHVSVAMVLAEAFVEGGIVQADTEELTVMALALLTKDSLLTQEDESREETVVARQARRQVPPFLPSVRSVGDYHVKKEVHNGLVALSHFDGELFGHLLRVCAPNALAPSAREDPGEKLTMQILNSSGLLGLDAWVSNAFVGFLRPRVLMWLWDQALMLGWQWQMRLLIADVLRAIREGILKAATVEAISEAIEKAPRGVRLKALREIFRERVARSRRARKTAGSRGQSREHKQEGQGPGRPEPTQTRATG
mmetsp:Transcript_46782/g.146035  ORF Transcript_46782/g.146035 Transcript_46782/m.146035 type:complete len:609 (-) Transcript_46782:41-1867(-)